MINKNKFGFTIVELMVAILIFTIGWLSAYLLIYSSITSAIKSKNEIIAMNIWREQIELIKNLRDTNWLQLKIWNKLDNWRLSWESMTGGYYTIENYFSDPIIPITIKKINDLNFDWSMGKVLASSMTPLCIDSKNRYTHDCIWNQKTHFYSFIKIEPLITKNTISNSDIIVDNAFKIKSVVSNTDKGYTEYLINTIITDWKKQ
jgi:prepilin-type N-terminal cleavage/methylation domain-containing protein